MKVSVLILFFPAAAVSVVLGAAKIFGGWNANDGQFPFYALVSGNGMNCGGSIIASKLVLTAAHCVYKKRSNFVVTVGTNNSEEGGLKYRTSQTAWAWNFNPNNGENDIGFVKVVRSFKFNLNTQPIPLASLNPVVGEELTLVGPQSTNNQNILRVLQHLQVSIIKWQQCANYYRNAGHLVHNGSLCTSSGRGRGGCRGDSGGPLVNTRGELVGVVSFGPTDCGSGGPDVFSSVVYYRSLILKAISWYNR